MQVFINKMALEVPENSTLSGAIACFESAHSVFIRPYAAAINLQFIPASLHADTRLQAGDQIEIIRPVTGG